jgi:hypothetical protein
LEPIPGGLIFAGGVGDDLPDVLPSGDWTPYLPEFDSQHWKVYLPGEMLDTMNCVQCSRVNASEMQANFHGIPLDLSDRFLYWATGCTQNGNSFSNSDFGIRKYGDCAEADWDWLTPMTRDEYGMTPPDDVKAEALKLLDNWDIGQLRWVPINLDSMKAALKKTPLWFCNQTHAMVVYKIDDRIRVWDSEASGTNGLNDFPLDYVSQIVACYNAPFTPKQPNPEPVTRPLIMDNALVFEAENHGRYGLKITSARGVQCIVVDDLPKLQAQFISRNSKNGVFSGGPSLSVTTADFDSFPHPTLSNVNS